MRVNKSLGPRHGLRGVNRLIYVFLLTFSHPKSSLDMMTGPRVIQYIQKCDAIGQENIHPLMAAKKARTLKAFSCVNSSAGG